MTKQEMTAAINQLAEEAFHLHSNKAARELDARVTAFEKEHHCAALVEKIFTETGASDTLCDMILNFDDSLDTSRTFVFGKDGLIYRHGEEP